MTNALKFFFQLFHIIDLYFEEIDYARRVDFLFISIPVGVLVNLVAQDKKIFYLTK